MWEIFVLIISAAILTIRILGQTELWQRKEYRTDRMWSVWQTAERWTIVSPAPVVAGLVLLVAWIYWLVSPLNEIASWLAALSILIIGAGQAYQLQRRGLYRPVPTNKGSLVLVTGIAGTIILLWLLFISSSAPSLLLVATVVSLVFIPITVAVVMVNAPATWRKQQIIQQATQYRRQLTALVTVGITGSYGKTSTKYFTQQLVTDHPEILFSTEHRNSPVVIAQDMLAQLRPDTAYYIAEMAAYRRGEIAELCRLVQPSLGVVTAIGNQHVALFGSQAAITQAKWELVASLPTDGTAILNADDERIQAQAATITTPKIIWFSTQKPADVYTSAVEIFPEYIACQLHIGSWQQTIKIPLLSEALLSSAVAAAALAFALGLKPAEIATKMQTLKPYSRTMELRANSHGSTIIDDSYSGNETGVILALQHLTRFKSPQKLVIFTPLIELGALGPAVHERIGQALAQTGAEVIVVNDTYRADLLKGGQSVRSDFTIAPALPPKILAEQLRDKLTSELVILLEGRAPDLIRQTIIG